MSMGRSLLFTVVFVFTIRWRIPCWLACHGGYDRMEERMRPIAVPPERSFSQTLPPGERLNVYSVQRTAPRVRAAARAVARTRAL